MTAEPKLGFPFHSQSQSHGTRVSELFETFFSLLFVVLFLPIPHAADTATGRTQPVKKWAPFCRSSLPTRRRGAGRPNSSSSPPGRLSPGQHWSATSALPRQHCHVSIATSAVGRIGEFYILDSATSALPGWQIMYVADVAG